MSIVAVTGDTATTTTVALASGWPAFDDVVVVEADPAGGDLAAWFDIPLLPSLSTLVTRVGGSAWAEIEPYTRLAPTGLRLVPAPVRVAEAQRAVGEAARALVPALAALHEPIALVDAGRAPNRSHPFLAAAEVTVVVHRQSPQSARASAVRLQRLADHLAGLAATDAARDPALVVAVVGSVPFEPAEIASFLDASLGTTAVVGLPVDDLAAAVLAGRTGVSARRLARLPLMRGARALALAVRAALDPPADLGAPVDGRAAG